VAKDSEKILALNQIMKGRYKSSPFEKYGTGAAMKAFEAVGNLPIRNQAGGRFANVEKVDAVALLRDHGTGMEGCFNCPIRCKKKIRVDDSTWDIDPCYGGPEYETLASFGPNLLIDDLKAICKANDICNSHGIDTISTGGTIAFAMECYENGILTRNDLDGLDLRFGNAQAMVQMVQKIANREGIGDLLANGSKKAARVIGKGSMKFAMQVKGLEIPYHNPRLHQGLGLHYSIHAVGADHVTGVIDGSLPALMGTWESIDVTEMIPPSELSGRKARMVYELGIWRQLANSLGICSFMPWGATEMCEAVEAVTGWKTTTFKLMKAVERGMTLMRIFNVREGFTREDDILPERFFDFPQEGPLKSTRIESDLFQECRETYYHLMGWNKDGVPTKACLIGLDLEWALPYLPSH
jgi:aldehyde:ferredoxin oxidoreductase